MDNTMVLNLAKRIKHDILAVDSGCYRLHSLPRCATLAVISLIIRAVYSNNHDDWLEVFKTELYKDHGSEYCHILAYSHLLMKWKELI